MSSKTLDYQKITTENNQVGMLCTWENLLVSNSIC